jgi:DNA replication and repair protein RecF
MSGAVDAQAHGHEAAETPRAWLSRLNLTAFRNYASANLSLSPAPVVLTGENGAGKTNILEAVSLLSHGRGLRSAPFSELCRYGAPGSGWTVSGRLHVGEMDTTIGTGIRPTGDEGRAARAVRIDGAPAQPGTLADYVRMIWLTPALYSLFTGAASERRRFLERVIISLDPHHRRLTAQFERAMRQRNRLLEIGGEASLLNGLEMQMAEAGVAIAAARRDALAQLTAVIARKWPDGTNAVFPAAKLELHGRLENALESEAAVDVEDAYARELAATRERDRAAKRTTLGPHRSDLIVTHAPKGLPARICSTGEQKALLVGLVLAHAELVRALSGAAPLILLDEIAAHLDAERRAAMFAEIEALAAQAWMTGTDRNVFAPLDTKANFFVVDQGVITPEQPGMC